MSESPNDVEATLLLCDAAQSVGGKLYIMGGGWSQLAASRWPGIMSLAIKVAVPWSRANEQLQMEARLVTDQGDPVALNGQPVKADGKIEVGRPPGLKSGTPLDAPFALNFQGLALPQGGYVWELEIDGEVRARAPFRVNP